MIRGMKICYFLLVSLILSQQGFAETAYIAVGKAKAKKTVLAFPKINLLTQTPDQNGILKTIDQTVRFDLQFMDLFKFLSPAAFADKSTGIALNQFKMSDWKGTGGDFLIKSALHFDKKSISYEAYLYEIRSSKALVAKKYVGTLKEARTIAHTFANDIVEKLTGLPGIFLTKIAMSCDRTKKKEIYVMDFDGSNVKQITNHRSIAIAPAWNSDGSKIAYSLFTRHKNNSKNIDLYEYSFLNNKIRLLSNRKGMNSGAAYHPIENILALTMSFLGNPEIFSLNQGTKKVTRLTHSKGMDVDPIFSPDGKFLAFSSSRSGKPMIYKMQVNGTGLQRLTYAGRYNATPSWSPQNNKIAFAGWKDGHFDIFIMNPDGTRIERLTKNNGGNEDPYFSPDGNFLVFSSNRTGKKNIYVMNIDGTYVKRLTYGLGNCVSPKWSAPPRK
tara:strand:- start:861 stop:2186 length:1326 start_codon:yes stop_codon:yes gene_type:complete